MEHTHKNILTFRSKHTIKSLLFTSFLAGMLGCTSSNKAELDDSDLQGLSSTITKLTEEKTKTEVELSKTAQEKNKLEYTNGQTAKDLETANRDLENTINELDGLKSEKERKKEEKRRLKEEKEAKKLQKKKEEKQIKKKNLTTAEKKFNKCKEKVKKLEEEKGKLTVHIEQCMQQMTGYQTEEDKTSASLKECKQELVDNSSRAKSLQQQLLLVAKSLKLKEIEACIKKEAEKVDKIGQELTELQSKQSPKRKEIKKKEEELTKHKQKLDNLIKIQKLRDEEDSKKLIDPIEREIKNCKAERAVLKQKKKSYGLELEEIEAKKENIRAKILNGQEKLKHIEKEIQMAVKKKGKLGGKVETLHNKS